MTRQPQLETAHYPSSVEVHQQSFAWLFMWYTSDGVIRVASSSRHGNGFNNFVYVPRNWVA